MCGIVGFLHFKRQTVSTDVCARLSKLISHRGPDDEGFLFADMVTGEHQIAGGPDTPENVYRAGLCFTPQKHIEKISWDRCDLVLINRRLAILDLSPAGHLPMSTEDRSLWLAYNGQVYNFVELREELQKLGHRFHSNGDSEVILKAYKTWGTECFERFNGMWAIAIWDVQAQKLVLSRDHLGIKPLYYWHSENTFAFASEIKCLLELGAPRTVNEGLIYDYLNFGLLDHTDETFFRDIRKLPPAHFLEINRRNQPRIERFWDFAVSGELYSKGADSKYAEKFRELFTDSVRLRLRSDVPVGSCLSGGLDSSAIVTIANNLMFPNERRDVQAHQKTFSSCFDDPRFDEREYIKEVLEATQAESNPVFPQVDQFLNEMEDLIWHQEEPFRSSSIYAQWCVMRRARERGIIVMLDGQGGDEQLCGYRKFYILYLMELLKRRRLGRGLLEFASFISAWEILKTLNLRHGLRYFGLGRHFQGLPTLLRSEFQRRHTARVWPLGSGTLSQRIKTDLTQFSLPVLLRYEDKNSMAHSVEARLPFLDHRLVEAIASFPLDQKIRRGWTKYVMRQALTGTLPEKIRLRKSKLGFVTPEDEWFKGDLSARVHRIFENVLFLDEYVDMYRLRDRYTRYRAGQTPDTSEFFFRFFILELWGRRFIVESKAPILSPVLKHTGRSRYEG